MMTMELSTSMPMAMMNAPREMRCSVLPATRRMGKVMAMVSTRPVPMISPLRKPMVNISTMMTMRTDSSRFIMKPLTASFTLSGWKNIFSIVRPTGTSFMVSSTFASTALPTSGTMTLSFIATQMARAGLPSTKKPRVCGSA